MDILFFKQGVAAHAPPNSLRAYSRGERPTMHKTTPKGTKTRTRCAMCKGYFGLIRYRSGPQQ
jgi:hypothetical protein